VTRTDSRETSAALHPNRGPVAVVDIGSNSIKLLVATRASDGSIVELCRGVEETRIGTGITENPPRLRADAMDRAVTSIRALLCRAAAFEPVHIAAVATSAVRDAVNGREFAERVRAETLLELSILAGREEARLIGRGIACDPAMRGVKAFYLFDLGGGSLEVLAFREGEVVGLTSLQLGCVRVTERFVPSPAAPLDPDAEARVRAHVRSTLAESGFAFELPAGTSAVVTGGTATTFRAIEAAAQGRRFEDVSPEITLDDLGAFARRLCATDLATRAAIPGLPTARADVFPAALVTLHEAALAAGVAVMRHSLYNLRYGLAAELLDAK
jgi:exopolyphosphatase/guanosine-5'-triphosphate,3'-diphosphate pyrophosphatase